MTIYAQHTCEDGSHCHLSHQKAWEYEREGVLEWLHQPKNNRDRAVVIVHRRLVPARGLSCRIGEPLTEALRRRLLWARIMLAEINTQPASRI